MCGDLYQRLTRVNRHITQKLNLAQSDLTLHQTAVSADITKPAPKREAPWTAGIQAAKANLLPGAVVQLSMLALVLAYYFHPQATQLLNRLADLKTSMGYTYAALSSGIAGAIIPEILRVLFFQKGKVQTKNATNLLFAFPFWAIMGITVDGFYQLQAIIFGSDISFINILKKVLLDQLGYTPFFATPITSICYDWKNHGFKRSACKGAFTLHYYKNVVFPALVANWGVWIPLISIIYAVPLSLQVPLFGLALSLWVTLYTWMSEKRIHPSI